MPPTITITHDSSRVDPAFTHIDRVDIRRLTFPAIRPHDFFYRDRSESHRGETDSRVTLFNLKKERNSK